MNMRFLAMAVAVCAFSSAGSANDLTDFLPMYDLRHAQFAPEGTRSIDVDNRDYDDYQAQYVYDADGRLSSIYFAGYNVGWGSVEHFKRAADGRLLSSNNEGHGSDVSFYHNQTAYTTDAQGRVTGYERVFSFSAPPEIDHMKLNTVRCTYSYDAKGHCVKVTLSDDGRVYDYDKHAVVAGTPTVREITYEYSPRGLLIGAVETENGKVRSRETFEYAPGRDEKMYLKKSVYVTPRAYGEGMCTITTDYTHFGEEVPSGYLKKVTYKDAYEPGSVSESVQTCIFNGLPISETEGH